MPLRLFGGEIGIAFMQTSVRVREQIHSNLVGLHVSSSARVVIDRLTSYQEVITTRTADLGHAAASAAKLLANALAQQAAVLSYIDGVMVDAAGAFVCLLLVALMHPPLPSPF
jgi:MFS transporter, DHA2 family, multidrug resistance protein